MSDRCNIHRGSGRRYRNNTDLFGITDTGVNRNVYPDRHLPCHEHVSDIIDRHTGCGHRDGTSDRVGGIDTDLRWRSRTTDRLGNTSDILGTSDRLSGTSDRRGRRNRGNCLCKIVHCLCGRRRHRRDSSSS